MRDVVSRIKQQPYFRRVFRIQGKIESIFVSDPGHPQRRCGAFPTKPVRHRTSLLGPTRRRSREEGRHRIITAEPEVCRGDLDHFFGGLSLAPPGKVMWSSTTGSYGAMNQP